MSVRLFNDREAKQERGYSKAAGYEYYFYINSFFHKLFLFRGKLGVHYILHSDTSGLNAALMKYPDHRGRHCKHERHHNHTEQHVRDCKNAIS